MLEPVLVLLVLCATIALFIWGYWRYDTVALISLIALVVLGLIPPSEAFIGFSNPAVVTVATVMVITRTIGQTGLVELVVQHITPIIAHPVLHIGTLCFITAFLSAFMNNVGALALMMPVALHSAKQVKLSPSTILMPLSFASVLGGLTTAIGTPPNLLLSAYKEEITGHAFSMFDFTPVGLSLAIIGLLFISLIGWRLIPIRVKANKADEDKFPIKDYISEVIIPEGSPLIGKTRRELEQIAKGDFVILGFIRGRRKRLFIPSDELLQAKDVLIIEASHDDLHELLQSGKLELVGGEIIQSEVLKNEDISLIEAVVPPGSRSESRSWQRMRIRSRLNINLLAIARGGRSFRNRLNHVNLKAGDVVLLQGKSETLSENILNLGLVPLAERDINVGFRRKMLLPLLIFLGAIFIAAVGLLPVAVSFTAAVVLMVICNLLPMRQVYKSIDWSIITLLAAMIPIGGAMQSSGATQLLGQGLITLSGPHSTIFIITLLLLVTMTLSDVMNNAATAVVMAPVAGSIANTLHLPIDPFLMSIAVGASCSFLTPISHQNNTLVMGPGGYKFFDYLRLGIPIELMMLIFSVPLIYYIWL
jgi:di/tricarboxylate transporter